MKAAYFGSFDPFHNGHLDIIRKASKLFNQVYVVIGFNQAKKRSYSAEDMVFIINRVLLQNGLDNCHADICHGLAIRYCEEHDINIMVRGLRNNLDYNYEENIALANKQINPSIETVYIRAELISLSSSVIREFYSYDEDVSMYVPKQVLSYMNVCATASTKLYG